jgi:uncharacterized protein (DUF927 family)
MNTAEVKNLDHADVHLSEGPEGVRACIDAAQPALAVSDETKASKKIKTGEPKKKKSGGFVVMDTGVYFVNQDGGEDVWICSPLHIEAQTRDSSSTAWGRLLEWKDPDGVSHSWAVPMELLQKDGSDLRGGLARLGLSIAPSKKSRDLLATYIQTWRVDKRALCVEKLGWYGDVYVTPSKSHGESDDSVVFQNAHAIEPALETIGTVEQWRDSVGRLAKGNSRLVFAISTAFAGALMDMSNVGSGGFHVRGASSTGKTTAIKAAASVWGNPERYKRQWRATTNGLEGLASLHNDGVLILDDIDQANEKDVGDAAYMLSNGQGKARADRNGAPRAAASWRLMLLSSGEHSLSTIMARAGKRATAGQEVRLADIEADAGAGMGLFESLHGVETPALFAQIVNDAAAANYGSAGTEWLQCLVTDRKAIDQLVRDGIKQFAGEIVPKNSSGQLERVALRFALVAVAGELASHYGITGWQKGESEQAAEACFKAWLEGFGRGNREDKSLLAQVRAFFEAHGASRFESMVDTNEQRVINRAGFYRGGLNGEMKEYLVLPEAFKSELCKGFDHKKAAKTLEAAGWIVAGGDGRPTQKLRLPSMGSTRCYVFTSAMWEGET